MAGRVHRTRHAHVEGNDEISLLERRCLGIGHKKTCTDCRIHPLVNEDEELEGSYGEWSWIHDQLSKLLSNVRVEEVTFWSRWVSYMHGSEW